MMFKGDFLIAGLRKVKDVVYEYVPGFLPVGVIFDQVSEITEEVRDLGVKAGGGNQGGSAKGLSE